MGKSTAVADLLVKNASRFDVVLCFIGSAACNPLLASIMAKHFDNRFFFKAWNEPLVARLLEQQEELRAQGGHRQALILVDDVVLTSAAEEQLCHLGMRGRHFNVSVITCSVSYTTLPKRFRRSLDVLMVFSCPMSGDMQILTYEFAEQSATARFAMQRLEDHECLVLETLTRRQQLFVWKARLWREEDLESDSEEGPGTQTSESCAAEGSGSEASHGTPPPDPGPLRRTETTGVPGRRRCGAAAPAGPDAEA